MAADPSFTSTSPFGDGFVRLAPSLHCAIPSVPCSPGGVLHFGLGYAGDTLALLTTHQIGCDGCKSVGRMHDVRSPNLAATLSLLPNPKTQNPETPSEVNEDE